MVKVVTATNTIVGAVKVVTVYLPCVTPREPGILANSLYAELLRAIAAHELSKSPHRESTGTCDKLQQPDPLLVVKLTNTLQTGAGSVNRDTPRTMSEWTLVQQALVLS